MSTWLSADRFEPCHWCDRDQVPCGSDLLSSTTRPKFTETAPTPDIAFEETLALARFEMDREPAEAIRLTKAVVALANRVAPDRRAPEAPAVLLLRRSPGLGVGGIRLRLFVAVTEAHRA
jgi:hypothetical protein